MLVPLASVPSVDVIGVFLRDCGCCTFRHRSRNKVVFDIGYVDVYHRPYLVAFLAFGSHEFGLVHPSVNVLELVVVVAEEVLDETYRKFHVRHGLNLGNGALEVDELLRVEIAA